MQSAVAAIAESLHVRMNKTGNDINAHNSQKFRTASEKHAQAFTCIACAYVHGRAKGVYDRIEPVSLQSPTMPGAMSLRDFRHDLNII